jgi:hypothetical protein
MGLISLTSLVQLFRTKNSRQKLLAATGRIAVLRLPCSTALAVNEAHKSHFSLIFLFESFFFFKAKFPNLL